jgi:hypothetical protein
MDWNIDDIINDLIVADQAMLMEKSMES